MPHPPNPPSALELRHLTAGYSSRRPPVLADVTLQVAACGVTRIGGPNGVGKSTLVEVASGYLSPWSGTALVSGVDASSPEARPLRRVCRTAPALYPQMTVAEHLELASTARSVGVDQGLERADAYGLGPWLHREAHELSTGNARKVWFVMCTVGQFRLAVLDEPFNGLDDEARTLMCEEIASWARDRGVVVVAHEPPASLVIDDEVVLGSSGIAGGRPPAAVVRDRRESVGAG